VFLRFSALCDKHATGIDQDMDAENSE